MTYQTYKNYEIIIISDGSTDGTNNFLSNNKTPKVRYVISETSRGASAARNVGKGSKWKLHSFSRR